MIDVNAALTLLEKRPEKIFSYDLCDIGTMLYQLSYQSHKSVFSKIVFWSVKIEGLFVLSSFHIATHFMVDPISFPEEQSSKKEAAECQPGTSGENNAEDQVPKPIRYMYCKKNDSMTRVLLARYQLSLYSHITHLHVCPFVSSSVTVCPFIYLFLNTLTSPVFAYSIIHSFTNSVSEPFKWTRTGFPLGT